MGQTPSSPQHRQFGGGDWVESEHARRRERSLSEIETIDWYSSLQTPTPAARTNVPSSPTPMSVDGPPTSWIDKIISGDHPWIFLVWLGFSLAVITLLIGLGINAMGALRAYWCSGSTFMGCYSLWMLFAIIFSMIALASTRYISVHASGSGIPECKVLLSDVILNRYLSLRTLIGKVIGLMAGFIGGLSIGKEGPYVHIAVMVANQWLRLKPFRSMAISDSMRMQLLSAACAVGVASAFGAPVGGVLFSIEVTTTYYLIQNLWQAFFAAVICSTTLRLLVGSGIPGEPVALFITDFEAAAYEYGELVVFVLMGAMIGLLSLLFIRLTKRFAKLRRKLEHGILSKPIVQVLSIAIISALIRWPWALMRYDQPNLVSVLFKDAPLPVDQYDTLSTPSLIILNLALFVTVKLLLTSITITLPIPCGLFMPVFAMGAAFGRMVGEIMAVIFPKMAIHAAGYSVVGAAAMASGVTRTVSTAVIVFEVTGQVRHMLPVLLAVIVSNAVCGLYSISIYDTLLRLLNLPHNISAPAIFTRSNTFTPKTAKEVMRPVANVSLVTPDDTLKDTIELLLASRHFVFPVVDSRQHMLLLGQVQRGALEKLVEDAQRIHEAMASTAAGHPSTGTSPFTADASVSIMTGRTDPLRRMRAMSTDVHDAALSARAAFVESDQSNSAQGSDDILASLPPRSSSMPQEPVLNVTQPLDVTPTLNIIPPRSGSINETRNDHLLAPETDMLSYRIPLRFGVSDDVYGNDDENAREIDIEQSGGAEILRPVPVDPAPFTIWEKTPVAKIHFLFTMVKVNHMFVTSPGGVLVGLISKRDFFEKHKPFLET